MSILFFVLGLGCFVIGMATGGTVGAFVNLPSLIIVVTPTFLFGAAAHSPAGLRTAVSLGLVGRPVDHGDAQTAQAALRTLRSVCLASGGLGTLIGVVHMLENMDDPAAIGPAMATALLSPLYAVMLSELLLRPLAHRIEALGAT